MPRNKTHTDVHIRFEIEDLESIKRIVKNSSKYENKTDLIRHAVKRLILEEQNEFKRDSANLVVKQVKELDDGLRKLLKLCWRAAAESMYIDLTIYKQSTPKALSEDEWDNLTTEAKMASEHWVEKMDELSAIDLVGREMKISAARSKQIPIAGLPQPVKPNEKPSGASKPKGKSTRK